MHAEHLLRVEPVISWDSVSLFGVGLLTNPTDLEKFYDAMHSTLVDAGVDGVKVSLKIRRGMNEIAMFFNIYFLPCYIILTLPSTD